MREGAMVEIDIIGDQGLVGNNAFFGAALMSREAMMQKPDTDAEATSVDAFRSELDRQRPFYECVQVYSQALIMLMMQSPACMALHSVEQRRCHWLLMTEPRIARQWKRSKSGCLSNWTPSGPKLAIVPKIGPTVNARRA
jgi:hypothetical protein